MKWVATLVVIATLGFTPGIVSAQVLVGVALGGLGSAGGSSLFDGRGGSRAWTEGALGVGYLHHGRDAAFVFSGAPEHVPAPVEMDYVHPVTGVWSTGVTAVRLNRSIALAGAVSYLLPTAVDRMTQVARLNNGVIASRSFEPHVSWWQAEGLGMLNLPGETVSVIAGFRFENFRTLFTNPADPHDFPISSPSDEAEVEIHSNIPCFGALITPGGGKGRLVIGMVGAPHVFGHVKYGDSHNKNAVRRATGTGTFNSASFLEVFSEYAVELGAGRARIFALLSTLNAKGILAHRYVTASTVQPCRYDFSFTRRTWVVGGLFSLHFACPISLTDFSSRFRGTFQLR